MMKIALQFLLACAVVLAFTSCPSPTAPVQDTTSDTVDPTYTIAKNLADMPKLQIALPAIFATTSIPAESQFGPSVTMQTDPEADLSAYPDVQADGAYFLRHYANPDALVQSLIDLLPDFAASVNASFQTVYAMGQRNNVPFDLGRLVVTGTPQDMTVWWLIPGGSDNGPPRDLKIRLRLVRQAGNEWIVVFDCAIRIPIGVNDFTVRDHYTLNTTTGRTIRARRVTDLHNWPNYEHVIVSVIDPGVSASVVSWMKSMEDSSPVLDQWDLAWGNQSRGGSLRVNVSDNSVYQEFYGNNGGMLLKNQGIVDLPTEHEADWSAARIPFIDGKDYYFQDMYLVKHLNVEDGFAVREESETTLYLDANGNETHDEDETLFPVYSLAINVTGNTVNTDPVPLFIHGRSRNWPVGLLPGVVAIVQPEVESKLTALYQARVSHLPDNWRNLLSDYESDPTFGQLAP